MKKRIPFYLFHFGLLAVLILLSVGIYFFNFNIGFAVFWNLSENFLIERLPNLLFIWASIFFLNFLFGLVSHDGWEKGFAVVPYLTSLFKLVLIIGMVSFLEFYLFYGSKIGRLIYFYFFLLFSAYYYIYIKARSRRHPVDIFWLAQEPAADVLGRYTKNQDLFRIRKFESVANLLKSDADIVYASNQISDEVKEFLIKSKLKGNRVRELVDFVEAEADKIPVDFVDIHWLLEKFNFLDRNYLRMTRVFDVFVSVFLLLILFPFGFLFSLVHRIFSSGPLFFIQERLGLHGIPFKLIKFRTMIQHAEKSGAQFAEKNDPRITKIGRILRRMRVDEIPQLINVIKGDMNLVGPRPERAVFIEELEKQIPYYILRLQVRPGITGWAQVQGQYAGNNIHEHREKLEYDLFYIKNRNFFLDLVILAKTVRTMFHAGGA